MLCLLGATSDHAGHTVILRGMPDEPSGSRVPRKNPAGITDCDLGELENERCRLEPVANPFGPKVLPMSPV